MKSRFVGMSWIGVVVCGLAAGCGVAPPPPNAGVVAVNASTQQPVVVPAAPRADAKGDKTTGAPSRFAGDKAERLIAERLRPDAVPLAAAGSARPLTMRGSRALDLPDFLLPPREGNLLRLPVTVSVKRLQPRTLPEDAPLTRQQTSVEQPARPALPAGTLVKFPGPDLQQPLPVPVLSRLLPDRAPLTDPTRQASVDAALTGSIPVRTTTTPFDRLSVPDPFENRGTLAPATPPEPLTTPLLLPRTPPMNLSDKRG